MTRCVKQVAMLITFYRWVICSNLIVVASFKTKPCAKGVLIFGVCCLGCIQFVTTWLLRGPRESILINPGWVAVVQNCFVLCFVFFPPLANFNKACKSFETTHSVPLCGSSVSSTTGLLLWVTYGFYKICHWSFLNYSYQDTLGASLTFKELYRTSMSLMWC